MLSEKTKMRGVSRIFTIGLGKERDYVVENLSMLVAAGMPIVSALDATEREVDSRRMKKILALIRDDIASGVPVWKALLETRLFADYTVSLIRLGEESGKLAENLKVVAVEQEKSRMFRARLHSAMLYPVFVLSLTVIVGVSVSWFILPKLAVVFTQMHIALPTITKVLIGIGIFLDMYGAVLVPMAILLLAALVYILFFFSKTKAIGQNILFSLPGIRALMKEVELARFGYLLGTLLTAGLPITHTLHSLSSAAEIGQYKKLYTHLADSVGDGNSFQKSFMLFQGKDGLATLGGETKRLIPIPIQQLVVAGEQSGTLAETLLKIGTLYEAKSDITAKNLTTILEPILLVIVWLGVVAVALAIILPIYSLIGGFNPNN